jgi:hypothetical protein
MTNDAPATTDSGEPDVPTRSRIGVVEWIVGAVCTVGVLAAIVVAMNYSGLTLFDEHAKQVIADAWNRNATIGLIVVAFIVVAVVIFVTVLARSTIGHDPADD